MKALNKESILYCDELETELHDAEMMQLDEQIFLMPNYPCEFEVKFLDYYHKKHNYPLFYESYLQNIMEFLESQDIKNTITPYFTNPIFKTLWNSLKVRI